MHEQILCRRLIAVLVNYPIQIASGELVELLLDCDKTFIELGNRALEHGAVFVHSRVNQAVEVLRLLSRDANGLHDGKALVNDRLVLHIWFAAFACFAAATVVAIRAAVALGPLRRHHRAAGATEQTAEREIVTVTHFARLALGFENGLHLVKEGGRNESFEFAFIHFAAPLHDADIQRIGEELPDGILRPLLAAPARHAEREQSLCRCREPMPAFRVFLEDREGDFPFVRIGHDVAQVAVIYEAERF